MNSRSDLNALFTIYLLKVKIEFINSLAMKRFTKFKIFIVLIYITILILISLMDNIIILAIAGSLIIVVDKFLIPELKSFENRVNLKGGFQ